MDIKRKSFLSIAGLVITVVIITIVACSRKFDMPPGYVAPNITPNTTIKALKAMHTIGGYEQIVTDVIISGIVVGDDKSGNLYKSLCIQDSSGGITVKLDGSNLYAQYPVGRQVFIKCKGLWLSDYGKLIQLSSIDKSVPNNPASTGIPSTLFDTYIVKGSLGNTITPKLVSISQFNDTLQSMLIQIKDSVQFVATDTALTYADTSAAKNSVNRTITDCPGNKVIVYTSGYANFAGVKTPKGKGLITSIYYIYKTTPELILRDTGDAKFTAPRCAASVMSLSSLKTLYSGSDVTLGSIAVKGVVISNAANVAAGNIIIQDGNSGIDLYFGTSANTAKFNVGDSIVVDATGGVLTSYKGMMELSLSASALPAAAIATGKTIMPQIVTIAQATNNIATLENTLIQINNAIASSTSGTTYSGNKTLADATGSTTLYTSSSASFATGTMPITCQNWVGYANRFTTVQFQIRSIADVAASTGCIVATGFTVNYPFTGVTTTSGTTDPTAVPAAQGAIFTSFNAVGVSANASASGRFSFTGWPLGAVNGSNTFTGSLSATQYYEVSIAPASGYKLDLSSIIFTVQRSATGVRQWAVRSSLDNFAANLPASINPSNSTLQANNDNTFQIVDRATTTAQTGCTVTLGSSFINISSAVTFRFYAFNAEGTGGTFSLNTVSFSGATH
jgi:hypothetical protein